MSASAGALPSFAARLRFGAGFDFAAGLALLLALLGFGDVLMGPFCQSFRQTSRSVRAAAWFTAVP